MCRGFAAVLFNRGAQATEILQATCRRCAVDRVREPKCCRGFAAVLANRGTLATTIFAVRLPSSPTAAVPAAETQAIRKACQLCVSVLCTGVASIIIESDSMVSTAWVNGSDGVGNVDLIDYIRDIKELMTVYKSSLSIRHVSRSSNAAADFLANQGALSRMDQMVWA
ncbi:hypothetical protein Q3G72_028444 [Acer saccharum]|nr:hypothetical protein Q3G72_028444 [Acer saccharum]